MTSDGLRIHTKSCDRSLALHAKGFHAFQEAARIRGESIDYSRKAQTLAWQLMAGQNANPEE